MTRAILLNSRANRSSFAGLWAAIFLVASGGVARAEQGKFNIHLGLGGTALATDSAAEGVGRAGLDLNLRADMPLPGVARMVAPQLAYAFDFLPGKSGVQAILVGARVRPLNDESGYVWSGWPSGLKKGNWLGNLYIGAAFGYVYAPTTVGDKHWFGYEFDLGFQISLASPLQIGPYVRYQHVVFKGTSASRHPMFIGFGISVSFGYPSKFPKVVSRPSAGPPEAIAEPRLEGKSGDRDGDGVGDATDLCPISAPRVEVDAKGCMALKGKMTFPELQFKPNTARIAGPGQLALKRLSFVLKAHSNVYVSVTAFADDSKDPQKNLTIANERAQAVRKTLVGFGIQPPRITATGSRPVSDFPGTTPPPDWGKRVVFRFRLGG